MLGLSNLSSSLWSCGSVFSIPHPSSQLSSHMQVKAQRIYKASIVERFVWGNEIEHPLAWGCRQNIGHSYKFEFQIDLTAHPDVSLFVLPNLAALTSQNIRLATENYGICFPDPYFPLLCTFPHQILIIVPTSNITLKKTSSVYP